MLQRFLSVTTEHVMLVKDFEAAKLRFVLGLAATPPQDPATSDGPVLLPSEAMAATIGPKLCVEAILEDGRTAMAAVDLAKISDVEPCLVAADLVSEAKDPYALIYSSTPMGRLQLALRWVEKVVPAGYTPTITTWGFVQHVYGKTTSWPLVRPVMRTTEGVVNWSLRRTGLVRLIAGEPEAAAVPEETAPALAPRSPLQALDERIRGLLTTVDGRIDRGLVTGRIRLDDVVRAAAANPYVQRTVRVTAPVGRRLPLVKRLYPSPAAASRTGAAPLSIEAAPVGAVEAATEPRGNFASQSAEDASAARETARPEDADDAQEAAEAVVTKAADPVAHKDTDRVGEAAESVGMLGSMQAPQDEESKELADPAAALGTPTAIKTTGLATTGDATADNVSPTVVRRMADAPKSISKSLRSMFSTSPEAKTESSETAPADADRKPLKKKKKKRGKKQRAGFAIGLFA